MGDIIESFVNNIVGTKFEDIPSREVEANKRNILDTMGAIIAGSSEKGISELVDLIKQWDGRKEATIWIYGGKVPAHQAALVTGAMARNRELESVHTKSGGNHVSATVLPASFAMAEYVGGISGKDFITAVALGEDIVCRLGLAHKYPITVTGRIQMTRILGPAAACAKILGLDREKTYNALGIAYSGGLTSIDMQQTVDGAMTSFLHYGFCAEGAVKATLLAKKGFTGTRNILQGKYGYFNVVEPDHDLSELTRDLGKRFEGSYASTKPYACCKCCHMSINTILDLVNEYNIKAEDVKEIEIGVGQADYSMSIEPPERYDPPNVVSSRFSIPYCVATAVVNKKITLGDFTEEALSRPQVRELMKKIKGKIEPEFANAGVQSPATAKVRTKGNREYVKRRDTLRGEPETPMTMEEIAEEKFRWCLPFAAKIIPSKNAEDAIRLVSNLESVDDITKIIRLLAP